jgi:hypothetical protein
MPWPGLHLLHHVHSLGMDSDVDVLSSTGIPKFYRWLSERYPLLNMPLTATEGPPELDNLYLDMNGIIHNCTHGNDPNQKLTEEEMILRIFAYLDKLIQLVRPKKLVFMAIDGEWVCRCCCNHGPHQHITPGVGAQQ